VPGSPENLDLMSEKEGEHVIGVSRSAG
jgi:hypothetical protein